MALAWKSLTRTEDFATHLGFTLIELNTARRQRSIIYVKEDRLIGKKVRKLCYPPRHSVLRAVQVALKDKCLSDLALAYEICGYLPGSHNINCAERLAGIPYVANLDISDFHPSIEPTLVTRSLKYLGVSDPLCRIMTQLVTYESSVPQGAPTSNHIANVVVHYCLSQGILEFAEARALTVVNFGDDTAFAGADRRAVDECVEFARVIFARNRLKTNAKSCMADHVGGTRKFIGTSTGRDLPDLPRNKYRTYRKAFRAALQSEQSNPTVLVLSDTDMRSLRGKVAYVRRLNPDKARVLATLARQIRDLRHRKCRLRVVA